MARGIDVFSSPVAIVVALAVAALIVIGWSMIHTLRLPRAEVGTKMRAAVLVTAALLIAIVALVGLLYEHAARRQLLHKDLLLPQQRWIRVADPGLVVRGVLSEACVPFSARYEVRYERRLHASQLVRRGDGAVLTLSARFLTQRGDTLGTSLGYHFARRDGSPDVCFERRDDPKGNRYAALELMASDTVTITAVNWWSGDLLGTL